jgi:hypothetical protein
MAAAQHKSRPVAALRRTCLKKRLQLLRDDRFVA